MPEKSKDELTPEKGERIAKRIASAGICSRRDAEKLILDGQVRVNKIVIKSPALNVTDDDHITVRGKALPQKSAIRLFMFHKPAGLVVSQKDDKGRATVFDGLPPELPRLVSVGRLDLNSEGLLLMTTSGELSRYLELPSTQLPRTYRVRAFGNLAKLNPDALLRGITVDGITYGPIDVEVERSGDNNHWLRMTLHEGKNREIRRVLEHLGFQVNRLIRVAYGPFGLADLPKGAFVEIPTTTVQKKLPKFFKAHSTSKNSAIPAEAGIQT